MVRDIDERIRSELQHDGKATMSQIAKRTGIPTTTVHNRIKRMEREGIIKRYTPIFDYAKLGRGIHAIIFINAEHKTDQEQLAKRLLSLQQVDDATIITGGFDMMVNVRAASIDELNQLIIRDLHRIPGIEKTQTMIVLKEL